MRAHNHSAYAVTIYIAGDVGDIRWVCQHWAYKKGACVTVTPTTFIYTGGREEGAAVGFVNYPRFPASRRQIWMRANALAEELIEALAQESALVQDDQTAVWLERRGDGGVQA
jgi:hypothetical protein